MAAAVGSGKLNYLTSREKSSIINLQAATLALQGMSDMGDGLSSLGQNLVKTESKLLTSAAKTSTNAISKIIDVGKQGKHIVGHNNYLPGKSILSENAQGLLDAFHSGNVTSSQVINAVKTRVNFGKTIGNFVKDGVSTPTTNGIIINAKNGVHIVPSSPLLTN